MPALLGKSKTARKNLIEHAGSLALLEDDWKLIAPSNGPKMNENTHTEMGNNGAPQLYNVAADLGETRDLSAKEPDRVQRMTAELNLIRAGGRSGTY